MTFDLPPWGERVLAGASGRTDPCLVSDSQELPLDLSSVRPFGGLPMESQSDAQSTPQCPFCGHGHGSANTMSIYRYERTITYVCLSCKQTWTATDDVQSAGLFEAEPTQLRLF